MTWQGDARVSTPEHRARRLRVLARDGGRCYVCGLLGANEMDHVIPLAEQGTDTDDNCRAIHRKPCHQAKSSSEGGRARHRKMGTTRRPPEQHPGLSD